MIDQEIKDWLDGVDVLVTGMSAKNPSYELALTRQAKEIKIPVLWFSDTHLIFNRPTFTQSGIWPDSVTVLDQLEAALAHQVGYPRAVVVGSPLWEKIPSMRCDVELVRKTLGVREQDYEKLFMVVLGKDSNNNLRIIRDLSNAVSRNLEYYRAFWLRFHPGDPHHPSKDPGFYERYKYYKGYSDFKLGETEALVLACDLVIGSHSGANVAAIFHRKPSLDYLPDYVMERLRKLINTDCWPPADSGASLKVTKAEDLGTAIDFALSDFGREYIRSFQERFYPIPEPNQAVKKIETELKYLAQTC